ncbi:MAG: ribonuclease HII [Acidobacteriota bacterium]|nr:MAG: ribonuclease HII [Acidobacteriota bacterium]
MTPRPPDAARRERLRRRERALRRRGLSRIAGVDEVGVGALAGPLVGAAVMLPRAARLPGVDDSKRMTPALRQHWARVIRERCIAWAVIEVGAVEVDEIGPYRASLLAKRSAVLALDPTAEYVLVDAHRLPALGLPQEPTIGADGRHLCVAAASVLAKVHRDALMVALDRRFPSYGFAQHKGYGTAAHLAALARYGPCPEHRRRYAPVREALGRAPTLFDD